MSRITVSTYSSIPNKLSEGRPIQVYIDRGQANPSMTLWPIPDKSSTYVLNYWRMRRIEDAGSGIQTADVNFRFLPPLVAGLAYYVAMKDPELVDRLPMLKVAYEESYDLAAGEDREKASINLIPRMYSV